jgi:hypothetical protein
MAVSTVDIFSGLGVSGSEVALETRAQGYVLKHSLPATLAQRGKKFSGRKSNELCEMVQKIMDLTAVEDRQEAHRSVDTIESGAIRNAEPKRVLQKKSFTDELFAGLFSPFSMVDCSPLLGGKLDLLPPPHLRASISPHKSAAFSAHCYGRK